MPTIIKKFQDWTLSWALTPWGVWALFICAFADASFLPLPTPLFYIVLALINISNAYKYAWVGSFGTLFGAILGYAIGHFAWVGNSGELTQFAQFTLEKIPGFSIQGYEKIQVLFFKWDIWVLLGASFVPVPYKLFSITSGAFDLNFIQFSIATLTSQSLKFLILGFLVINLGPKVKGVIALKRTEIFDLLKKSSSYIFQLFRKLYLKIMVWLKGIYEWVLQWADSKYGPQALFLLAFFESIFFPIPPDVLLIALAIGNIRKSFHFALYCTIGTVLGAFAGYAIGHYIWIDSAGGFTPFAMAFFNHVPGFTISLFNNIKELFNLWDFWVIFTAGFTPVPYKVFTVSSGVFDINFLMFTIASIISRGARFFLVSFLIWRFGVGMKSFIEKYFNPLAIGFTVCLIAGFASLKYLF